MSQTVEEEIVSQDSVSQAFHIGAIFIVLGAGFLGVIAPAILVKKNLLKVDDKKFILGKAFSGGVILGTGFVHMLPEAQNQLNESLPDFPYSGFFAGLAAIISLIIEQLAFEQIKKIMQPPKPKEEILKENRLELVHLHSDNGNIKNCNEPKDEVDENKECGRCDGDKIEINMIETNGKRKIIEETQRKEDNEHNHHHNEIVGTHHNHIHDNHNHNHNHAHDHEGHTHGMMGLYSDDELSKRVNSFTIAHVLEIGIAFHSIIIGIALSVEMDSKRFEALLIAICFHQFFEGFALGSSVQGAKITNLVHVAIMTMIFSLSAPIGQGIGMGVASMYDEESPTAQQTQGIFDSFSGGILIYMALVDLISEDFKKSYEGKLRYWMLLFLCLGYGFMSILALWA